MQTSKTKPAPRRLSFGLVVWLVLSISVVQIPFATLTTPAIASPTLDPALEQAVKTEIITQHPTAASTHIIVSPINQVKAWVFGSTAIIPQPASTAETDDETVPLILLFLAEQQASGWNVALEHSTEFTAALTRIPQNLLTPEQWATMPTTTQLSGDGSMWLNLPWAVGETWLLTGGPHGSSRHALDFAVSGGQVRAAREGVAYTPCGQGSDYVRIDHVGFSTNYYHLSGIAVANGSAVGRYTYIGRIGTGTSCLGGYVTGAHVHFWITRGTTRVPINGIDLGGWTVSELPGEFNGCMTRIRDGYRQCTRYDSSGRLIEGYGRITNEGALGSGNIPPNPPILLSPADNETVRTNSVQLCVDNGGDPDNGPHTPLTFLFRITKADNSWSASSGLLDDRPTPLCWTVTLPSEGTYTWLAMAGDWADDTYASPRTLHYRRNVPPNPPILLSPADNETVRNASVQLCVDNGGDPDNGPHTPLTFLFRITKADNSWSASSGLLDDRPTPLCWTVTLPSEGTYTWLAMAGDWADDTYASPRTLHYQPNRPPNPPNLINPAANATVNTANVTLQATDGGDPDNWPSPTRQFRFMIAKSDNSWRAESDWINSTSWTVQLPSKGVYTWQVQANDGALTSDIAGPRTIYYTIAAPVPQPPTPPPLPNNVWPVPYYSQLDPMWSGQTMRTCNIKIGPAGCALTSATMIARFYGADLTPSTMNTCLGNYACPLYWSVTASCTRGKMSWVRWASFSYANLEAELKKGPVILELAKSTGDLHFIVVIGGSGTNPANYTVHDPGVRNGANTTLANVLSYWGQRGGYRPSSMRIYTGTPAPLPASIADETTELRASQSVNLESETIEPLASPPLLSGETITGAVVMYRNTSSEMVLELSAQSAAGTVSAMQVWTDIEQSTVWQPFSRYVTVPLAQTYYVRFRDTAGNTSAVISTGFPQVRNLNVFTTFIPITVR